MKKTLLLVLLLLPLCARGQYAVGDTLYYDMVCYKVLTDSTVEVSRGYESGVPFGDTLVIPETITPGSQSFRVVALGSSAFNSYANPKVLVLPSSIKTIKYQCFYASRVTDPGLPEGLERIEYEAFFAAPYLQKLYLPASLSYVGHAAFAAASRLDSIFVEESNAHFCSVDGVLYSKDTAELVCRPAHMGDRVFTMLPSVTSMRAVSCGYNSFVDTVVMNEGLRDIGGQAFCYCDQLKYAHISSTARMRDNAFAGCHALADIDVDEANPYLRFNADDSTLLSMDGDTLVFKTPAGRVIRVPQVKHIGDYALDYCYQTRTIYIPFGVESIGKHAFEYSQTVRNLDMESTVKYIDDSAFFGMRQLEELRFSKCILSIGAYAFAGCNRLPGIDLGDSIRVIREGAFEGCSSMDGLTLSEYVERIEDRAFYNCQLADYHSGRFYIPASVRTIGNEAFRGGQIRRVTFRGEVDSIGKYAFGCATPSYTLQYVTMNQATPPVAGYCPLGDNPSMQIRVPCRSASAYQNTPNWDYYTIYVEQPCDSVGIDSDCQMEKSVSVSPNPATGSAEVLSSFGVSRVEVFNAADRKVMDLKAEGLKATLDVSKLPSGAYLLRIHTPQGMTTKKLLVR